MTNDLTDNVELSAVGITLAPQVLSNGVGKIGVISPVLELDLIFPRVPIGDSGDGARSGYPGRRSSA